MKRLALLAVVILLALGNPGAGRSDDQKFNHVSASDFKEWLQNGRELILVDIQPARKFSKHHFAGSIETNAFPVKSKAEQELLIPALEAYQASGHEVVVICPAGGGGAERAFTALNKKGIPHSKLFILTGGIKKWPYQELFAVTP